MATIPGGAEAPWMLASPIAALNDAGDGEVIREVFRLGGLSAEHPILLAWNSPTTKSRRLLHQLAEDARLLRDVPGFGDPAYTLSSERP